MPIYLGNQKIKTLYVGGQKIKEAWTMVGGVLTKVYSSGPTILVTDNFNRTAGELTTPWNKRVNWYQDYYRINANGQVQRSGGGSNDNADGNDAYIHGTPFASLSQYARIRVAALSGTPGPGIALRTGTTSGLAVMGQITATTWRISIATAGASGSRTVLTSGSGSFTAGGILEMTAVNDVAVLKYAGVEIGNSSGTALPTGLYGGFSAGNSSNSVDDYAAGTP